MPALHRFPREASAYNVTPIRADLYDMAYRAALDAKANWPALLGYAQTLSHSPLPAHTGLARHIRNAYSLHCEGLLKQVNPAHRDRSDMVDGWRESALVADETSWAVVRERRRQWPQVLFWGAVVATAMLAATGWLS